MQLIQLTHSVTDKPIYVNPERISAVKEYDGGAAVLVDGNWLTVRESVSLVRIRYDLATKYESSEDSGYEELDDVGGRND